MLSTKLKNNSKSKKILIVFPNEWLSYTPTLLNLIEYLSTTFEVKAFAIDDGSYSNENIKSDCIIFIKVNYLLSKIAITMEKYFPKGYRIRQIIKFLLLYTRLRKYEADEIIAVDSLGLYISQKIFKKCHFLSLEPYKDFLFRQCNLNKIESVIAHSKERYDFLFNTVKPKYFILPNSPIYDSEKLSTLQPVKPPKAIFFGNATPRNGVYLCLEAFRSIKNISLVIRGSLSPRDREKILSEYEDLLESGILSIDEQYIRQTEVTEYISQFSIGFCFYDFNYVDEVTRFNFISVPSGKMFNYYAAGVPVIGSDILGLKSVKDFNAGILLKTPSSETIVDAIKQIMNQHDLYRDNCLKAAKHFDFNKSVKHIQEYLLQK